MRPIDTLKSYVPSLIVTHLLHTAEEAKLPQRQEHATVAMFADVSGFTALSEAMMMQEEEADAAKSGVIAGVEGLAKHLNAYFGQMVRIIAREGGDVFKFAGDAMIILWPPLQKEHLGDHGADGESDTEEGLGNVSMEGRIRIAIQCAFGIQEELHDCVLAKNVKMGVKIGIGMGKVAVLHLGGVHKRMEYVAVGEPLLQAFQAEHHASQGHVIVSESAYKLVNGRGFTPAEVFSDGYVRVEKMAGYIPVRRINTRHLLQAGGVRENPMYSHFETVDDPTLELKLKAYIPGAVLTSIPDQWGNEIRPVTVVFANLGLKEHHLLAAAQYDEAMSEVHNVMVAVQDSVYEYEGSINKFLLDDKGSTLVAVFGLPPVAHADDPVRGILSSLRLCERLFTLGLTGSMGITTGKAFCGVVGSKTRREYTVLGDRVNLAARLMQRATTEGGGVICDLAAQRACHGLLEFTLKGTVRVKGKKQLITVFQPYPPDFRKPQGPEFFGKNMYRQIHRQQTQNFVMHHLLTSLQAYLSRPKITADDSNAWEGKWQMEGAECEPTIARFSMHRSAPTVEEALQRVQAEVQRAEAKGEGGDYYDDRAIRMHEGEEKLDFENGDGRADVGALGDLGGALLEERDGEYKQEEPSRALQSLMRGFTPDAAAETATVGDHYASMPSVPVEDAMSISQGGSSSRGEAKSTISVESAAFDASRRNSRGTSIRRLFPTVGEAKDDFERRRSSFITDVASESSRDLNRDFGGRKSLSALNQGQMSHASSRSFSTMLDSPTDLSPVRSSTRSVRGELGKHDEEHEDEKEELKEGGEGIDEGGERRSRDVDGNNAGGGYGDGSGGGDGDGGTDAGAGGTGEALSDGRRSSFRFLNGLIPFRSRSSTPVALSDDTILDTRSPVPLSPAAAAAAMRIKSQQPDRGDVNGSSALSVTSSAVGGGDYESRSAAVSDVVVSNAVPPLHLDIASPLTAGTIGLVQCKSTGDLPLYSSDIESASSSRPSFVQSVKGLPRLWSKRHSTGGIGFDSASSQEPSVRGSMTPPSGDGRAGLKKKSASMWAVGPSSASSAAGSQDRRKSSQGSHTSSAVRNRRMSWLPSSRPLDRSTHGGGGVGDGTIGGGGDDVSTMLGMLSPHSPGLPIRKSRSTRRSSGDGVGLEPIAGVSTAEMYAGASRETVRHLLHKLTASASNSMHSMLGGGGIGGGGAAAGGGNDGGPPAIARNSIAGLDLTMKPHDGMGNASVFGYRMGYSVDRFVIVVSVPPYGDFSNLTRSSARLDPISMDELGGFTFRDLLRLSIRSARREGVLLSQTKGSELDYEDVEVLSNVMSIEGGDRGLDDADVLVDDYRLHIMGTRVVLPADDRDIAWLPCFAAEAHICSFRSKIQVTGLHRVSPSLFGFHTAVDGVIEVCLVRRTTSINVQHRWTHGRISLLERKMDLLGRGMGSVSLLEGAAGAGKTELLSLFAAHSLPKSALIHYTAGSPFHYSRSFGPWSLIVEDFLDAKTAGDSLDLGHRPGGAPSLGLGGSMSDIDPYMDVQSMTSSQHRDKRQSTVRVAVMESRAAALQKELKTYSETMANYAWLLNDVLGTDIWPAHPGDAAVEQMESKSDCGDDDVQDERANSFSAETIGGIKMGEWSNIVRRVNTKTRDRGADERASLEGLRKLGYTVKAMRLQLMLHLVRSMARTMPRVVIIDDAHLLDKDSWSLALQVATAEDGKPLPIMIALALRPLELNKGMFAPIATDYKELVRQRHVQIIKLDGLPPEEAEDLMLEKLGNNAASLSDDLFDLIEEKAEGNPALIIDIIALLKTQVPPALVYTSLDENEHAGNNRGSVAPGKKKPAATKLGMHVGLTHEFVPSSLGIPAKMEGILIALIDRLNRRQQLVLKCAALIGEPFSVAFLVKVFPTWNEKALLPKDVLELVSRGFLKESCRTEYTDARGLTACATTASFDELMVLLRDDESDLDAEAMGKHKGRLDEFIYELTMPFVKEVLLKKLLVSQRSYLITHIEELRYQLGAAHQRRSLQRHLVDTNAPHKSGPLLVMSKTRRRPIFSGRRRGGSFGNEIDVSDGQTEPTGRYINGVASTIRRQSLSFSMGKRGGPGELEDSGTLRNLSMVADMARSRKSAIMSGRGSSLGANNADDISVPQLGWRIRHCVVTGRSLQVFRAGEGWQDSQVYEEYTLLGATAKKFMTVAQHHGVIKLDCIQWWKDGRWHSCNDRSILLKQVEDGSADQMNRWLETLENGISHSEMTANEGRRKSLLQSSSLAQIMLARHHSAAGLERTCLREIAGRVALTNAVLLVKVQQGENVFLPRLMGSTNPYCRIETEDQSTLTTCATGDMSGRVIWKDVETRFPMVIPQLASGIVRITIINRLQYLTDDHIGTIAVGLDDVPIQAWDENASLQERDFRWLPMNDSKRTLSSGQSHRGSHAGSASSGVSGSGSFDNYKSPPRPESVRSGGTPHGRLLVGLRVVLAEHVSLLVERETVDGSLRERPMLNRQVKVRLEAGARAAWVGKRVMKVKPHKRKKEIFTVEAELKRREELARSGADGGEDDDDDDVEGDDENGGDADEDDGEAGRVSIVGDSVIDGAGDGGALEAPLRPGASSDGKGKMDALSRRLQLMLLVVEEGMGTASGVSDSSSTTGELGAKLKDLLATSDADTTQLLGSLLGWSEAADFDEQSSNAEEEEMYMCENGHSKIHGPFTGSELVLAYKAGYLRSTLRVRKVAEEGDFVPIDTLLAGEGESATSFPNLLAERIISGRRFGHVNLDIRAWNFDIFSMEVCELPNLALTILADTPYPELFSLDSLACSNFTKGVGARMGKTGLSGGIVRGSTVYHNMHHAVDVMHTTYMSLMKFGAGGLLTEVEELALLIAALCHDLDHPGLNNRFQVATHSTLAVRYNDQSPLENHHISTMFQLLRSPGCTGLLDSLGPERVAGIRRMMIQGILATDMAVHDKGLSQLKEVVASQPKLLANQQAVLSLMEDLKGVDLDEDDMSNVSDRQWEDNGHLEETWRPFATLFLPRGTPAFGGAYARKDHGITLSEAERQVIFNSLLHGADLSSLGREWDVCRNWTNRVMDEFNYQAEKELAMGLPVTVVTGSVPRAQVGILNYMEPYYHTLMGVLPGGAEWMNNMARNKKRWEKLRDFEDMEKDKDKES